MRRTPVLSIVLLAVIAPAAAASPARFMRYPDIRGDLIVFSYEGDLWSMPAAGGTARRLTTHPGTEEAAKIAPDGKTVVFTGAYDGAPSLYVMPAEGGVPQRLTWVGSGVQAVTWTADGRRIVFRSGHENTFRPIVRLYSVTPAGSYPERLPVERGVLCSFSADGSKMVYNRRGNEEYYWKRYKGGQYLDIWLYDFTSKQFTPLTDYVGKNAYPMWIGSRMYFVSDRGPNGIANLYTYDFASKKVDQVTRYEDFDVQMPSTDGRRIVFLQAGYLHLLDTSSNQVKRLSADVPSDRWALAERTINPRDYVHAMSVSNDGRTAVFEARGDVYLVPVDEREAPRNLTRTAGTRERFPQLSPDGRKVAFISDRSGSYQIYLASADGTGAWEPLTKTLDRTVYHLEWSPDGTKILFGDKDLSISYLDVATRKLVKVAGSSQLKNDEFSWEVSDYSWSPDSRWIAYSSVEHNRNNRVWLYSLDQGKSVAVTDGFFDSPNPSFDANGEFLYFLSYRDFTTRIDIFEDNHVIAHPVQVMAVALQAGVRPPYERTGEAATRKEGEPIRVDLAGLDRRVFALPVPSGNYYFLKAGHGVVTYASIDFVGESEMEEFFAPGGEDKWTLHAFDMGSGKDTAVEGTVSDWRLSPNRLQMIARKGAGFHVAPVGRVLSSKGIGPRLSLDRMSYTFTPVDEWLQIFNDTWRWYHDFFYDTAMHGRDWAKMGDTYRPWVKELSSRSDLNWLLSQVVGELCVSHTYVSGGDPGPQAPPANPVYTGLLGADLAADPAGYYRFARVFGPTSYEAGLVAPLVRPDRAVQEGEFLIAIDGREIRPPENPYRYLQVTRGQKVSITVSSKPASEGARTIDVEPVRSESSLRYNRWLADNIEAVRSASNGDLGYMHITAMSTDNIGQFDKFWRAFRYKKGIVIDVRGNGGGWTEYFIIDKLEREMVAFNTLRGVEPFRYPGSTATGPIAVLTNEYNGSDGEAFLEHFKARKLGTVIGVPSWGGLVGIINGQRTIDNGTVHQSNNAFYGRQGTWWVENHGADPDILLENDPASATAGKDLQLERAIALLLEQIKAKPFVFPAKPAIRGR